MQALRTITTGLILVSAIWIGPAGAQAQSVPPFIPVHPMSATVNLGDFVTLTVVADFALTYQWRLNGANIDGANTSVLVINSVALSDLGSYRVVVSNPVGTVESNPAILSLNSPPQPPTGMPNDDFSTAFDITTLSSPITSVNSGATQESDEPRHGGKGGASSVWYSWKAVADGVATFETTGSTFDTLLGVYTGTNIAKLDTVAGDDDSGERFTSKVRFNTTAGTAYHIAVASLGDKTGPFILAWDFDRTRIPLPVFRSHPQSRAVPQGATTTLSASAASGLDPVGFQWYFNGAPLLGETSSSLQIVNVQRHNVGTYFVRASNSGSFTADSQPATLEIGPDENVVSYNKLIDLRQVSRPPAGASATAFDGGGGGAVGVLGFVSVSIGGLGQQILNNTNSTMEDDFCSDCDVVANGSRWYGFTPEHNGIMTIDTIGSDVDTILAGYLDVNFSAFCDSIRGCDTNGAPNGINSQISFWVHAGTNYIVGVNSQSDQEGIIHLNYQLCSPLAPFSLENNQIVLEVEPATPGIFDYHWSEDGAALDTTALPVLPIDPLSNTPRSYSVTYSNKTGSVTTNLGSLLNLQVGIDHETDVIQLRMTGVQELAYQIETAHPGLTNCQGNWLWLPVDLSGVTTFLVDKQRVFEFPLDHPNRLFRVRPPPPPFALDLTP